ncbi:MAG: FKBP-type peptidyl-prolyl cis-trans isomerase [Prolixibacteraceae bacterium]|jgi:hypothetical protein|nr:FKBP-type peptidyl-prolyl cis-trans isomerase [Prolixibacteraceae bacterium]
MNNKKKLNKVIGLMVIALSTMFFSCSKTNNQKMRELELELRTGYIDRYHNGATPTDRGVYVFPDKDQPAEEVSDKKLEDGQTVRVYYEGYLLEKGDDGVQLKSERFDGNFDYKTGTQKYDPFQVEVVDQLKNPGKVSAVISGWQIALLNMHKGERAEIVIPSSQGYSIRGSGSIGPYETLVFFMKVEEIVETGNKEPIIE